MLHNVPGILSGLYGIGALLVTYISRTAENRSQFRANICCVFLTENLFRLFLYRFTGILNREALYMAVFLAPAVILGMIAGVKIDKKMNETTVKKSVVVLLIITGALLFVKSILFH